MVTAQQVQEMINMKGLTILPFHETHMARVNPSEEDRHLFACMPNFDQMLVELARSKTGFTIFYEMQPALCFGLDMRWPTMAEAWLVPGPVSIQHGTLLSRGTRRFFDKIGPALGLRRLQIVVSVHRERAIQWAKFLKFKEEGLMAQYGPEGFDYYMYARIY